MKSSITLSISLLNVMWKKCKKWLFYWVFRPVLYCRYPYI